MSESDNLFDDASPNKRVGRTYFCGTTFINDMRKGELMEYFLLSEGAFQEIIGEICASMKVAEEVNNAALVLALKADKGQELGGILEMAETVASGR